MNFQICIEVLRTAEIERALARAQNGTEQLVYTKIQAS